MFEAGDTLDSKAHHLAGIWLLDFGGVTLDFIGFLTGMRVTPDSRFQWPSGL